MAPVAYGRPMFFRSIRNTQLQMIQTCGIIGVVVTTCLVLLQFESEPIAGMLELYSKSNYTLKNNGWNSNQLTPQSLMLRPSGKGKSSAKSILTIKGSATNYIKVNLQPVLRKDKYSEINMEFVTIDPAKFTKTLQGFIHLKKLSLINVKLAGSEVNVWQWNFTRVILPHLEEFTIDLTIGFRDQYREYLPHLTEDNMRQLLFYDKSSQLMYKEDTKGFSEKLVVDGVEVAIKVDGWYVLSLKQLEDKSFDVMVALTFANDFLRTINTYLNVTSLAMTECGVSKSQIPQDLTYLNFYRVTLMDADIEEILDQVNNLSQLFVELKNATLRVSKIPETVKELAISDVVNAKYRNGDKCGAKKVGVGFPMDSDVIENFASIFFQVETIGIFEPVDGMQHIALQRVCNSSATWAYFEGFNRKGEGFINNRTQVEADMEDFLNRIGVSPEERNFMLVRNSSQLAWSTEIVTDDRQLLYRYQFLGWDRFISESMYNYYFSQ